MVPKWRKKNPAFYPSFWGLPGGILDYGEKLTECVKREIKEELGVVVEVIKRSKKIYEVFPSKDYPFHTLAIVFYAKIGSETGDFDMADIIKNLNKKLIYRHPHIFSDTKVNDAEDVKRNWEELKIREGKKVLEGVPGSLPAMIKANRIQEKVRAVGFDWDEKSQIWDKVREELEELETEVRNEDQEKTELEFGDLLFSVINAARLYGVDPETALEKTNLKFIKRFGYLEKNTLRKGRSLKDMNLDEMNEIWEQAKDYD